MMKQHNARFHFVFVELFWDQNRNEISLNVEGSPWVNYFIFWIKTAVLRLKIYLK